MSTLPVRPVGKLGLKASAQGLGCMGMSAAYKSKDGAYDDEESLRVIDRALELGVNFLDTSDAYGPHTNERLVGRAIKGRRERFVVATKFGIHFDAAGAFQVSGSAQYVRQAVEGSLERLGTDYIDLYYQHRVDRSVPIEETWAELKKLVEEGKVRYLGISEASAAEIRRAHAVHPITACQLEWSLWTRDAEREVIPTCRELGIAIVAYSPLGRGFLTGTITSLADLSQDDWRVKFQPRFAGDNLAKNLALVDKVKELAARKGCTPGQLALAWVHAQGEDVFPIPGTKRVKYLEENAAAALIKLTSQEMKELEDVFHGQVAGERYVAAMKQMGYEGHAAKQAEA